MTGTWVVSSVGYYEQSCYEIHMHGSLWIYIFIPFGFVPRKGISASNDVFIVKFLRNIQTV